MTQLNLFSASPWCQRWRDRQQSWQHTSAGGFNPDSYTVEAIPEAVAKKYVLANHYSGSIGSLQRRFGLLDRDENLVGVATFGVPGSPTVLPYVFPGLQPNKESCELNRLVLDDEVPANAESWFIARCFEQLVTFGFRGVVSFSDPVPRTLNGRVIFPGHVGTIYQASNARYCGTTKSRNKVLLPDGYVLEERTIQKVRKQERGHEYVERHLMSLGARTPRAGESMPVWLSQALGDIGATKFRHSGQHRYAFVLGNRRERRQIRVNGGPFTYPKKEAA